MIEFDNVSRKYGPMLAVDRLSLTIPQGELFALLGPNGAGKTTTIRMLVGLLRPDSGTVRICGHAPTERDRRANSLMGYVPDEPYLYDKLSGREILEFAGEMHGLAPAVLRDRIARECARFELDSFIDDLTETYSHGMRQRMVFASALLHDPAVLVVDEPMVGLDPYNARVVKDLLRTEAAEGRAVLMSTHTLAVAEEIADRIGILHRGRLQFLGTVAGLQSELASPHESLEPLFLQMTGNGGRWVAGGG
jgi:ABC-2 type transport system ATP-binding protein